MLLGQGFALASLLFFNTGCESLVVEAQPEKSLLIDVSRHFWSLEELHALLAKLHDEGFTRLHLHLTDGPGWRMESKAYPLVTTKGAWRVDKTDQPWNWRATEFWTEAHAQAGLKRYGGFYTIEELKALNEAARRYAITIVPEIDLPGHSAALMFAYPELACPTNQDPSAWLKGRDVLCISNPQTIQFAQTIIREVAEIFPGSPIHIGCDEVPTFAWADCPQCCDPAHQKQFYEALIQAVRDQGVDVYAWDELAQTGVDISDVTLTCWHDEVQPRANDIACPYSYCYLDQAKSRQQLPQWEVPMHVKAVQLNLWTEEMPTREIREARLQEGFEALEQAFKRGQGD